MPSYLTLRIISFIVAFGISVLLPTVVWIIMMTLAIVHYCLAVPYSKNLIAGAMSTRATACAFVVLMLVALAFSIPNIPGLLFLTFGFHYVFSEVYLMHENVLPSLWKETRSLRVTSVLFNLSVYFASVKEPVLLLSREQTEAFSYAGCALGAVMIAVLLFKLRGVLSKKQTLQICGFESFGLAFVLLSMVHPVPVSGFIFYHVIFWLLYPSSKMIQFKQLKPLAIFAAANLSLTSLLTILLVTVVPVEVMTEVFRIGALFHIIASLGMTTAQPAFLTRMFHRDYVRKNSVRPACSVAKVPAIR
jgi:hypothetical protein